MDHLYRYRTAAVRGGLSDPPQPLPRSTRIDRAFAGHDLGGVRVHEGPHAREANLRLHSDAFTYGDHIVLGRPATPGLLAHEITHVLQQRGSTGGSAQSLESSARRAEVPAPKPAAEPGAPAVVQFAPNQAGVTDPSYVVNWVRAHQAPGGRPADVMDALSAAHGGNTNRYFYTGTYGWVDVRHFGAAAALAARHGSVVTEALGFANEVVQWATEWGDDYRSGFSPEDIPSNAAGAEFGDDYVGARAKESTAEALARWMTDNRALPATDPGTQHTSLPLTDPSDLGGAARGSSNVSRTQSTVSGEAARQSQSATRTATRMQDPWFWFNPTR